MSSFNVSSNYQSNWNIPNKPQNNILASNNKFLPDPSEANTNTQPWYSQAQKPASQKNYSGIMSFNVPKMLGNTGQDSVESSSIKAHWGNASATNNFNLFKGLLA